MYLFGAGECARLISSTKQKVVQNKKDYDEIIQKLEAIVSMAQKYQQHGSQRALDRRVEELSMCVVHHASRGHLYTHRCLSAVKRHTDKINCIQERWLVRRAFDNAQDVALVSKSFRDIGILMNAFQVSDSSGQCSYTDGFQMDTVLHVDANTEEILQRLKNEDASRESIVM